MFFVYILEALETKRYYIGQTENLDERVRKHNEGKNLSTKPYLPWQIKWYRGYDTRAEAIRVERKLKGIKRRAGLEKFVIENNFTGCGAVG
jgi:putative endonuclease